MQDGEIGVVRAGGTTLDIGRIEQAPELDLKPTPAPFAHWMLREIHEQPEAIARALAYGGRLGDGRIFLGGLDRVRDTLHAVKNLLIVGCGESSACGPMRSFPLRNLTQRWRVRRKTDA